MAVCLSPPSARTGLRVITDTRHGCISANKMDTIFICLWSIWMSFLLCYVLSRKINTSAVTFQCPWDEDSRENIGNVQTSRLLKWMPFAATNIKVFSFTKLFHFLNTLYKLPLKTNKIKLPNKTARFWQPIYKSPAYLRCLLQSICNNFSFHLFLMVNY